MNRTRKEEFVLGFIPYPKWPVFASLLSLIIGSVLVCYSLYTQLPADLETFNSDEFVPDISVWYIIPFLYLSVSIDETKRYRMVCDISRELAAEKNISFDDEQISMMADEIMRKIILVRILNGLSNVAIVFLLLQGLIGVMLYLVY
jgi:hypothetical protein